MITPLPIKKKFTEIACDIQIACISTEELRKEFEHSCSICTRTGRILKANCDRCKVQHCHLQMMALLSERESENK